MKTARPSSGQDKNHHQPVSGERELWSSPDLFGIAAAGRGCQLFHGVSSYERECLLYKIKRHPNGITKEDTTAQKAENLLARDFTADAPNRKWLADITEISCRNGKLYVAPILDCFDGQIVGLAMDDNMRAELCIRAFENACKHSGAHGMILHSDRGSQFTSVAFRQSLARHSAIQSMSGTGRCYDNARMESFFATLKKEKPYRINTKKLSMEQVKSVIFRYIMVYYNRQHIYTSNPGGWLPAVYRNFALPATA